ncbi:hypothetical protein HYH02_002232 [Chlamydomonas schloesseri]|uniref:Uncharacterized protein n=1 Tax=Chlamydomonas schloesseri TaxID=2026947 RepID=A0A836BB01_9CHLO|nr:hypothetical protein HYH02_002232 [Chlamydomonas schloesseri]|eukprot:KAG2452888.1 hypothetical protein HYH02_002232 [Chlamydomonas schloesseri]
MSSICKDYESYDYSSYSSERAALDNAIDEHAGTDASYFSSSDFAQQAYSYCNSDARSLDVAASFKGFGVKVGVSTSMSSSSARCGSQSASSYTGRNGGQDSYFYGYNSKLQQSKFAEAKTNIKQLKSTMCGSDSSVNSNSNSVQYLQQVIEPAVFAAYTSCLDLYKAGVQVKQTTGIGSRSFAVDIKFTPGQPGATAYLKGVAVSPQGTAACRVLGCRRNGTSSSIVTRSSSSSARRLAPLGEMDSSSTSSSGDAGASGHHRRHQRSLLAVASPSERQPPRSPPPPPPPAAGAGGGAATQQQSPATGTASSPPPPPPPPSSSDCPAVDVSMNLELSPTAVYSLLCELTPGAPSDGGYTEVYLSTSVGGTYKGVLSRRANQTQLEALAERLAQAENQAALAAQDVSGLRGLVAAQAALLKNVTAQLSAVLANATQEVARVRNLTTQAVTELRNYTDSRLSNFTSNLQAAGGAAGGAAAGTSVGAANGTNTSSPRVQVTT